jgi:modification methylase
MEHYYEHAGVMIYHGDTMEVLSVLDANVNLVVTSPPYNQMSSLNGKPTGLWAKSSGGAGFVRRWNEAGYPDNIPEEEYQDWQNACFGAIAALCTDDASLFYNHQIRWRKGFCLHPVQWFTPDGWRMRQEIIWNRGGGMMMNARMFVRFDERILWFVRGDKWKWNQTSVGNGTIWNIPRMQQQQGKCHPVEFPIDIPSRCIAAASELGDVVLDPFMGSGTTLRAAKDMGRKAIGIEIEEKWCEVAANRLSQECLPL